MFLPSVFSTFTAFTAFADARPLTIRLSEAECCEPAERAVERRVAKVAEVGGSEDGCDGGSEEGCEGGCD